MGGKIQKSHSDISFRHFDIRVVPREKREGIIDFLVFHLFYLGTTRVVTFCLGTVGSGYRGAPFTSIALVAIVVALLVHTLLIPSS